MILILFRMISPRPDNQTVKTFKEATNLHSKWKRIEMEHEWNCLFTVNSGHDAPNTFAQFSKTDTYIEEELITSCFFLFFLKKKNIKIAMLSMILPSTFFCLFCAIFCNTASAAIPFWLLIQRRNKERNWYCFENQLFDTQQV